MPVLALLISCNDADISTNDEIDECAKIAGSYLYIGIEKSRSDFYEELTNKCEWSHQCADRWSRTWPPPQDPNDEDYQRPDEVIEDCNHELGMKVPDNYEMPEEFIPIKSEQKSVIKGYDQGCLNTFIYLIDKSGRLNDYKKGDGNAPYEIMSCIVTKERQIAKKEAPLTDEECGQIMYRHKLMREKCGWSEMCIELNHKHLTTRGPSGEYDDEVTKQYMEKCWNERGLRHSARMDRESILEMLGKAGYDQECLLNSVDQIKRPDDINNLLKCPNARNTDSPN